MTALHVAAARWGMSAPITAESNMPPPSKEQLDRRLENYLDDRDEEQRRGITIGAVKESVQRVADWTQTHEKKDDTRHDELSKRFDTFERAQIKSSVEAEKRFESLESDIRELKPAVRDTADSIHDLTEADLEKKVEDERIKRVAVETKWNRALGVVAKVAMAVVILIATTCVGYALGKLGLK